MKRAVTMAGLLVVFCLIATRPAEAQQKSDTVEYIDPKTKAPAKATGQIAEESPAGIKFKDGKLVQAQSITQVTYHHPDVAVLDFRRAFAKEANAMKATRPAERKNLLANALTEFQELAVKVRSDAKIARYIQFKMVQVKVQQAYADPDDPALRKAALAELKKFKDSNATGWEIVPCLELSARAHEEAGDSEAALEAYEALLQIPNLPTEIQRDAKLKSAQMLVHVKRYPQAEKKLKALADSLPPENPQRALVQVYMVESQLAQNKLDQVEPALKAALQASSDPGLKATAHNFLGDYYRMQKQDGEALWQYLMVDALYSQDKDQHAKALYYLSKLFTTVQGNKARAEQFREKLIDKAYAGNEYQRKALEEK
jgi:hypothetical protein